MTQPTRRSFLRGVSSLAAASALSGTGLALTASAASAQVQPLTGKTPAGVKALFYDVFGTLVDWRTGVAREGQRILGPLGYSLDWIAFADAWRAEYQPAMEEIRAGRQPFSRLDVVHRSMLERIRPRFGLENVDEAVLRELNLAWHRLDAWPGVTEGLRKLRTRYRQAPVSNGNIALMADLARRNDILWDAILGAEVAGDYKPKPRVYLIAAEAFGLTPEQCMFCAAHAGDLQAAARLGFRTGFITQFDEFGRGKGETSPGIPVDVLAPNFKEFARVMTE